MTRKCSLFKKCPFEIRKVFKNKKGLILNMKSMLLSYTKDVLLLNTKNVQVLHMKNVIFLNKMKCIAFK